MLTKTNGYLQLLLFFTHLSLTKVYKKILKMCVNIFMMCMHFNFCQYP